MTQPLRLGIAGLGTVGMGVVKIIQQKAEILATRGGQEVVISAVSARSKDKDRGFDLSAYAWEDDPVRLATRDDVDIFIELIGGSEGPALAATQARRWHRPRRTKTVLSVSKQPWQAEFRLLRP